MPEEKYMRRAIELAKKGSGRVNPNPLVGAVIVKDGQVLAEGYHECYGKLHAERNAIAHAREAGVDIKGSTIYVTLEPCSHYGKQPPCALALIEEGIARVVVGSDDPNPLVSGRGYQMLRDQGVEVITHFLKEECDAINDVFFHYIQTKTPYVAMKYAMTMDGKIACHTGDSRWVTGEESRAYVQKLRNHYKGIMAGIGTVLADDPMLNCRIEGGRDPVRIICDDHLRIPMESQLVSTAKKQLLIIACLPDADAEKEKALTDAGAVVLRIPAAQAADDCRDRKTLDLKILMKELGARSIDGILLEGGGTLNESAVRAGIVQRAYCFIAPKIFGGSLAKTPVEGQGVSLARDAWHFTRVGMESFGQDIMLEFKLDTM
ncbi:MAG: bifunctional diaminohydroxyphosphoribosylaminopyrimidine deaminase/5-amino-6-(5-phosphoribosylamino)uracil reductase RibD [Eubacterium sp.]|nr:bifunctional diaminohydroxyphosphoribosylaminopyrimidine deaminase/5-amino-6-(5-phosphoribosylamino)uracil reductase RibD [Eubacterium sp.]